MTKKERKMKQATKSGVRHREIIDSPHLGHFIKALSEAVALADNPDFKILKPAVVQILHKYRGYPAGEKAPALPFRKRNHHRRKQCEKSTDWN